MTKNFETAPRATPAEVTTVAVLAVMLAMGASSLFPTSVPASTAVAGHDTAVQVVHSAAATVHKI